VRSERKALPLTVCSLRQSIKVILFLPVWNDLFYNGDAISLASPFFFAKTPPSHAPDA
jgi:hypothetical protein